MALKCAISGVMQYLVIHIGLISLCSWNLPPSLKSLHRNNQEVQGDPVLPVYNAGLKVQASTVLVDYFTTRECIGCWFYSINKQFYTEAIKLSSFSSVGLRCLCSPEAKKDFQVSRYLSWSGFSCFKEGTNGFKNTSVSKDLGFNSHASQRLRNRKKEGVLRQQVCWEESRGCLLEARVCLCTGYFWASLVQLESPYFLVLSP